ncbi:MAG TPA: hypothetical protein VKB18_01420 [Gemmatimonadota bacterium]|nr:hypothetical protein [Gemmatimonadota bacterium]
MPASDRPDANESQEGAAGPAPDGPDLEGKVEALAGAIERLLEQHLSLREHAARAERLERGLSDTLRDSELEGLSSADVSERLRELAEENERLRKVIRESRERAERIRSRLVLMEDEA